MVYRSSINDVRVAWSTYFSYCENRVKIDYEQCALKTELLLIVLDETMSDFKEISSDASPVKEEIIMEAYKRICRHTGDVDVGIYGKGMVPPMPDEFDEKIEIIIESLETECEEAQEIYKL